MPGREVQFEALIAEVHLLGVPDLVDLELRNLADRFLDLKEWREVLERQSGGRRVYPYPTPPESLIPSPPGERVEGE